MKRNRLLILFIILYLTNWSIVVHYGDVSNDKINMAPLAIFIGVVYTAYSLFKLILKATRYHRHGIRVLRFGDIRCLFLTKAYVLLIPFFLEISTVFENAGKVLASWISKATADQVTSVTLQIGRNGSYTIFTLFLICIIVEQLSQQIDWKIDFKLNKH